MLFKAYQLIPYLFFEFGDILAERKFSLYDVEQFIREAGAEKVTEDAVLDLEKELEKLAESVANKAMRYAEHAGRRRLIKKSDIVLTKSNLGVGKNAIGVPSKITPYNISRVNYRRPRNLRTKARSTNAISIKHR